MRCLRIRLHENLLKKHAWRGGTRIANNTEQRRAADVFERLKTALHAKRTESKFDLYFVRSELITSSGNRHRSA